MVKTSSIQTDSPLADIHLSGSFEFQGQSLFSGLDIEIKQAAWTCFLGASGVGKSTLLRILAGLETGGIFTGNIETGENQSTPLTVAYMAQTDLLFPWLTVRQNVSLGHRLRNQQVDHQRVDDLIEQVGLKEHAGKKPRQLSGGMRQRTALARTLMEDTPVVLLDEPFSALDTATRTEMQLLAHRMLKGKTVLLVTHDITEAMRLGNYLYILKNQKAVLHPLPSQQPVRDTTSDEMLKAQAQLLGALEQ